MANYKEDSFVGNSWIRCGSISIENRLNQTPQITFTEEEVLDLGVNQIVRPITPSLVSAFNPSKIINIRNPITNELTGQVSTYGEAYVLLSSAYYDMAYNRDAAALAYAATIDAAKAAAAAQLAIEEADRARATAQAIADSAAADAAAAAAALADAAAAALAANTVPGSDPTIPPPITP